MTTGAIQGKQQGKTVRKDLNERTKGLNVAQVTNALKVSRNCEASKRPDHLR